ncbi:MAG: 50S ribosomal protein L21 [bacterium]|jgi:large subunit ribosomal protein L21
MYAVLRTGGKQYRVETNDTLVIEKIDAEAGTTIELNEILMVRDETGLNIGSPTVVGAKVMATVLRQGKGKKIIGFTYKAKKNERRRFGHRQPHTYLKVTEIVSGTSK